MMDEALCLIVNAGCTILGLQMRNEALDQIRSSQPSRLDMRTFAQELIRTFFERKLLWALPVGLMLLVLVALIIATDVVPLAPFQLHHSL